ncbi:MAG: hypothetical protein MMC23_003384 [Stictis urceolatum]|nr:hypothetical protein [Stictis urceolata]
MPETIEIEDEPRTASNNSSEHVTSHPPDRSRECSVERGTAESGIIEEDDSTNKDVDASGADDTPWDTISMFDSLNRLVSQSRVKATAGRANSGVLSDAPSPGLFFHKYGIVGLPLSERVAQDLKDVCDYARANTEGYMVKRGKPNAWAFPASQFELRNPKVRNPTRRVRNIFCLGGYGLAGREELVELQEKCLGKKLTIYRSVASVR